MEEIPRFLSLSFGVLFDGRNASRPGAYLANCSDYVASTGAQKGHLSLKASDVGACQVCLCRLFLVNGKA